MSDENPLYGYALLPGPAIVAWQGYDWLRTASWTPIPVSKMFTYSEWPIPRTSWPGLQSIINWLFDIPASLVAFILSLLLIAVFAFIGALFDGYQSNRKSN
jgi:hypothetical protein